MKFKFPLQKVLEHRKTLENIAQRDFQQAQAIYYDEIEILKEMEKTLTETYEKIFHLQHQGSGRTSEQLQHLNDFIKGQKIRIERQRSKIQECEKVVEELREILRGKAIDYKIIDKLRERKKAAFEEERRKYEQNEMDEMNVLRKARGEQK